MEKLSNATAMDSSMRFHCVKTNEVRDEERKKRAFFFPSSKRQERERVYKGRNCLLFFFFHCFTVPALMSSHFPLLIYDRKRRIREKSAEAKGKRKVMVGVTVNNHYYNTYIS